ncbi:MAG: hypothetical protein AAF412_14545 [Pseudomonadota bacterium]
MRAAFAIVLLIAGVWLAVVGQAMAQTNSNSEQPNTEAPADRISDLKKKLESGEEIVKAPIGGNIGGAKVDKRTPADTELLPNLIDPSVLDDEGKKSMRAALKGYYDYRIKGFNHRARVFEWQLLSSRIIFVLVILIVLAGLYFSWLQFMAGQRGGVDKGDMSTTVEATISGGIKVSSPILGVIILTLSLIFFYLYLVHVYPISEIF